MLQIARHFGIVLVFSSAMAFAQQQALQPTTAAEAPNRDTSYIDANGTAHVTRVVPVPQTSVPRRRSRSAAPSPTRARRSRLPTRRKGTDAYTARARVEWTKLCPNTIVEDKMAGVPVRIVTPEGMPDANKDKVLLNLHGGGFNSDSGSYTESIPIASYTGIKVVAVLYRLAPEHPFPAAVDDSIAVYKELLKTYKPDHIVIYGTSAGAILTAEVAVKIKQLGLPHAGGAGHLQRHGRLCARGRLDGDVCAARTVRASRSAGRQARTIRTMSAIDRSERPGALADLCRPSRAAADAVCHQRTRPAAERHGQSASRLSACRCRCAAGGLRRAAARLLVRPATCRRRLKPTTSWRISL